MGSKINFFPHLPLANELRKFTGHRFFLSFFFLYYIIFIFFYNVLFKSFEPVRFVLKEQFYVQQSCICLIKNSHTVKY